MRKVTNTFITTVVPRVTVTDEDLRTIFEANEEDKSVEDFFTSKEND